MKKINKYFPQALLFIIFFAILYLNYLTQLTSDDFRYSFFYDTLYPTNNAYRISSVFQIFPSMLNHYFEWGGRVISHFLVQFFLMFEKSYFNIFNAIIYMILGFVIYKICLYNNKNKMKDSLFFLVFIYIALWFCIPQFGLTILWLTGSFNYLFVTVVVLLNIYLFLLFYHKNSLSIGIQLIFIINGFIAGCSNENSGGALIIFEIGYLLYNHFINKVKINRLCFFNLISTLTGTIVLLLSPGNSFRLIAQGIHFSLTKNIIISNLRKILILSNLILLRLIILFLVLLFIYVVSNHKRILEKKDFIFFPLLLVLCAASSVIALVFSPEIYERSWFLAVCLMITAIGILFLQVIKPRYLNKIMIIIFLLLLPRMMNSYNNAVSDIRTSYYCVELQKNEIYEQKSSGILNVEITPLSPVLNPRNAFSGSAYLSSNSSAWLNQWMSLYYQVDSISLK